MINFLQYIENNDTVVQAISSLVIAVFTIFYVFYTRQILKQQKKEEVLKNRAYVAVNSATVVDSNETEDIYLFVISNNGGTPASDLSSSSYFVVNNKEHGKRDFENSPKSFLSPDNKMEVVIPIGREGIKEIIKNSEVRTEKYLVIEVRYKDYSGKERRFVSKYNSVIQGENYHLTTFEQFEVS